ncbi:MAG: glycosyltransferase family 4 protein [Gaiellaceae bacterium]
MEPREQRPTAFFLYRDSALRRAALESAAGSAARYSLYGLDELADAGWVVRHNLEPGRATGHGARAVGGALDRLVRLGGGYSGDFPGVLVSRRALGRTDVVFSTVDTVGIPLVLISRLGLVQTPIVYAAIGLPERLEQLRGGPAERLYLSAYRRLHTILAYGAGEVDTLRAWLGEGGPKVVFVPFGVDTESFRPDPARAPETDVVSAGSDPRRDFGLLLEIAARRPEWSVHVVGSSDNAGVLTMPPANLTTEVAIPFVGVRDRLASSRVVALPVRENSYSGATTVLLQSMALGKPVVVSWTAAIARGYHLEDGVNCRLVPPGDGVALERAIGDLLADPEQAAALGARARETVERHLGWDRYAGTIQELLTAAAGGTTVSG